MAKRFYELKGNPKYTSPEAVNKIVKNFLDVATDPRRIEQSVWITRSQGMGKDETFWGKARPGIWTQGATHTQAEYDEKKAKGKLHSSPHLRRPHTDLGSIIYHTAREYNTRLKKKLIDQGLPEPQVQSQLAKRAIKVRPMLISASHTKQYGRKVATEIRERAIEELGKKQVITFTRSGDIERKYERGARQLFENLQEARKDSGFKSKGASDKLIDQFIDEVNVEIDGKPKYSHEFKEGAYKFLLNKEADWHFSTDVDERLLTDQRLQDMRTWTRGSNIQSVDNLVIPKYEQKPGDIGTEFKGQTPVHAETVHGPDLPENLEYNKPVATGDYAFASDYLTEDYPENKKVASMITTSGDELPPAGTDPTIKETKVSMTRPQWKTSIITDRFSDVPDYNPSMSAFPGQGEGGKIAHTWLDAGQIYWSEQIDTKLRESELVASSKSVKPNVSAISSSYSDVMAAAQHKGTTDAVSELIYGFVDDIGEEVGGFEDDPKHGSGYGTHDVTQANERDIKERKTMENIEYAHQKGGWGQYVYWSGVNKGLSIETPKVMEGVKEVTATDRGVYQPDESKPVYEDIWGQSSEDTSKLPNERTTTVKASDALSGERVGGEKTVINQGDVDANLKVVGQKKVFARHYPTMAEKERQARLSEMTPVQAMEAKKDYVAFRNQKIKEYNLRMQQGTQQSFIHGLRMKNRNQLHKAPVEATGKTMTNPAAALLNPKQAKTKQPVSPPAKGKPNISPALAAITTPDDSKPKPPDKPKGKGPGVGKVTKSLVVGGLGLGGFLAAPYFAARSLQAKNIKDPTFTDYLQETGSELVGSYRVWSGVNEKPGYFQKVGPFTKGVEGGRRPIKPIPGAGGPDTPAQALKNFWGSIFGPSSKDDWKNRKRNRRN